MATSKTLDLNLETTKPAKTLRFYLQRNAARKRLLKAIARLQDAESKVPLAEPLHLPLDAKAWTDRVNRLWPM